MSMEVIYRGEFVSRCDDSRWCVSILREQESALPVVGELEFAGREPLLIEWVETAKEDVVCGSTATLKVLSPGDRTYADLYTIEAGRIGLRVYREGVLYWQGTLDAEFYEEPYTAMADYEVELTFSDFGILDRLKYRLEGVQTLETVVNDALGRCGLSGLALDQTLISSVIGDDGDDGGAGETGGHTDGSGSGGNVLRLSEVSVRSENFTDEDGEVMSLKEVVEGVLQPLGLRMVQKGGKVWVYDLNGLYESGASTPLTVPFVSWHDADQVLGVDKVANSVKVTFSPYGGSEVLGYEIAYLGWCDKRYVNVFPNRPDMMQYHYFTYYPGSPGVYYGSDSRSEDYSFTIFESDSSSDGVGASLGSGARYFHIEPIYGGEACDGVAWGFMTSGPTERNYWVGKALDVESQTAYHRKEMLSEVLRSYRVRLPKLSSGDEGRYLLRLKQEVLFDVRYNPFEPGSDENNGSECEWVKDHVGYMQVPVKVELYGSESGGTAERHWTNHDAYGYEYTGSASARPRGDYGRWAQGGADWSSARLEWYDASDRGGSGACQGWKVNRECIGLANGGLPMRIQKQSDGQLLPYPSDGGWIEVSVGCDVYSWDYDGGESDGSVTGNSLELQGRLRWQLYKAPTIEIVDSGTLEAVELDDVELKGTINANAQEEIEIDTVCGMLNPPVPTALGQYYESWSGEALTRLSRGGRSGRAEELLIGTLHSQYGERHVRLSGTVFLLDGGLKVYREAMQGGRLFMVTGDIQDVDAGTSEAVLVELSGDDYDAV